MLNYFQAEMIDAVLKKTSPGAYVEGSWTPGASLPDQNIRIIAPQPIHANDTALLPQGEDLRDYLKTYADETLDIMPRTGQAEGDQIVFDGKTYKVFQVDRRRALGNYHKIIMRSVDGV